MVLRAWQETAIAYSVYMIIVAAFPINAHLAFRKKRSFVVVLLLTLVLYWFVTIALLVLPPGERKNSRSSNQPQAKRSL